MPADFEMGPKYRIHSPAANPYCRSELEVSSFASVGDAVKVSLANRSPRGAVSRREIFRNTLSVQAWSSLGILVAQTQPRIEGKSYSDGRPSAILRLNATDAGPIIRHGQGPSQCDYLGAREAICFRSHGIYYLHYDGAGPTGWLACSCQS